jgi:hypothetical protein
VAGAVLRRYLGLIEARAIMAASSLGVIAALDERPDGAQGLGRRVGITVEGAEVLLAALVSLGYLRERRGLFRPTPKVRRWLRPGAKRGLDRLISSFTYDVWEHMGEIERALGGGDRRATRPRRRRPVLGALVDPPAKAARRPGPPARSSNRPGRSTGIARATHSAVRPASSAIASCTWWATFHGRAGRRL